MGNINRPKLDTEDIELMRKIGKHNFVDMIYIYNFIRRNAKKKQLKEGLYSLLNIDILA